MRKMYIDELIEELNYADARPVKKWCAKNGITLMGAGKSEYVFESEFRMVQERPFILKLKKEFGSEWESVYQLHVNGNIPALAILHALPEVSKKTWKPKSQVTSDYKAKFLEHARA